MSWYYPLYYYCDLYKLAKVHTGRWMMVTLFRDRLPTNWWPKGGCFRQVSLYTCTYDDSVLNRQIYISQLFLLKLILGNSRRLYGIIVKPSVGPLAGPGLMSSEDSVPVVGGEMCRGRRGFLASLSLGVFT